MRTSGLSCLLLVSAVVAAAAAEGEPRALVERAVKALGGEDRLARLAAVHTRRKGSFVGLPGGAAMPGIPVTAETWAQPGAERMTLVLSLGGEKTTMTRAVHGGKGWEENNGTVKDMGADELKEAKRSAHVERVLALVPLLRDRGFTLKALGKRKVGGAELESLHVSSAGNPDVTLYFDPATGYPKRAEYREKSKALGKEVTEAVVFDDYREVDPAAAEARALEAAKVPTDGPGLLGWLRRQAVSEADLAKVKGLVKQLGDDSFEAREKATRELVRLGAVAAAELRRAAKDPDKEVAARAQRCLKQIDVPASKGLLSAALAVVAVKRPAGAAEALLALAPTLTDEADARDLRSALAAVALRDGKAEAAVEKALADPDPARRAAAEAALGKDKGAFEKQPGRRLFLGGVKRAMKTTYYQDGARQMVLEVVEVRFYNRFDDKLFARPR